MEDQKEIKPKPSADGKYKANVLSAVDDYLSRKKPSRVGRKFNQKKKERSLF